MNYKKKTLPQLKKIADRYFNKYIRLRDEGKPCISCGEIKQLEAGHYYAKKGYDGLRYDEMNVNGECHYCNCFDQSHLIGYGENLVIKFGSISYSVLKGMAAEYKKSCFKWYKSDVIKIIETYKKKCKSFD